MSNVVLRAGAVATIALSMAAQGCLVPWSKYIKVKKQHDQLAREVERKDSQLADDQETIRSLEGQVSSMNHIVTLYRDQKKEAERLAAQTRAELDKVQKRLEEIARTHGEGVEIGPGGALIIRDKLLFALGSADVSEQGRKVLQDIAAKFKGTGEIIQIDGHTDDIRVAKPETVKRFTDNWGLAASRANAVLRLLAKSGIAEKRMYSRAFSMHKPRVPNANDANRAKNRRVEVMFIPPHILQATRPAKPAAPKKK